jgi:hypothetical protein
MTCFDLLSSPSPPGSYLPIIYILLTTYRSWIGDTAMSALGSMSNCLYQNCSVKLDFHPLYTNGEWAPSAASEDSVLDPYIA